MRNNLFGIWQHVNLEVKYEELRMWISGWIWNLGLRKDGKQETKIRGRQTTISIGYKKINANKGSCTGCK